MLDGSWKEILQLDFTKRLGLNEAIKLTSRQLVVSPSENCAKPGIVSITGRNSQEIPYFTDPVPAGKRY